MDIYLNIIIKRDKIINVSGMKSDKKIINKKLSIVKLIKYKYFFI